MVKTLIYGLAVGLVVLLLGWQSGGQNAAFAEVHTGDLHNCDDFFPNQKAAQAHLKENPSDPDDLDHDSDGIACEHLLDCPCDPPNANDAEDGSDGGSTRDPSASGGGLCHEQCLPEVLPACNEFQGGDYLYSQCTNGLNSSPGFNRSVAMTFLSEKTTIPCGGQTRLVARAVYPDGVGAPNRLFTFQSSLGTVRTNLLSDYSGYVETTFAAPMSPAIVQIDAIADGLRQTLQVKVECAPPPMAILQQAPGAAAAPLFSPPRTGEAGLASY